MFPVNSMFCLSVGHIRQPCRDARTKRGTLGGNILNVIHVVAAAMRPAAAVTVATCMFRVKRK